MCLTIFRDQRAVQKPRLELVESHTDTITSLELHPSLPNLLLSSSTDGLISIFDTSKPEEDDALYQVINHRSAVAHAGFMLPSTDIYALGTDETMSFYALQSQKEDEPEPAPKAFGDVREKLQCEYLAKIHWIGDEAFVAAGKHRYVYLQFKISNCFNVMSSRSNIILTIYSESSFDLIPLQKNISGEPLQYEYDLEKSVRLSGAHGEEIIRDVFTDVHVSLYSCLIFVHPFAASIFVCKSSCILRRIIPHTQLGKMAIFAPGNSLARKWTLTITRKRKQSLRKSKTRRARKIGKKRRKKSGRVVALRRRGISLTRILGIRQSLDLL